ncbi:MAG TPA: hypothetical protein VF594_07815 [Rubricoccaceae bacterium]|jgi:hypothetical protein
MRHVRHSAAWLLLAAAVFGGTVAPAVHRVAHGLERAATVAAHAADGHHAAGETGPHVREACARSVQEDLACTLCGGLSAAVAERAEALPVVARGARPGVDRDTRGYSRPAGAASVRGPPGDVA